jgi:endonuclease/exonuclease/phosphatase family metal-dependent hydrolase
MKKQNYTIRRMMFVILPLAFIGLTATSQDYYRLYTGTGESTVMSGNAIDSVKVEGGSLKFYEGNTASHTQAVSNTDSLTFNEPPTMNVMTFNIYVASGNKLDWNNRRNALLQFIRSADVDILGTQETELVQHNYLKDNLTGYDSYGVGREDGQEQGNSEHNTIFYRKSRFTEQKRGTFWLSETPDVPSRGWNAGYTRIASWMILEDKVYAGKRIFVINTHIDHIGSLAQQNSIPLLLEKISELHGDLPVVLTGDFNMPSSNSNIRYITATSAGHYSLLQARNIADKREGNAGSFHNLNDADPGTSQLIDFIFVSRDDVRALHYKVFPPRYEGAFLSDHSAVMAKIHVK